MSTKNFTFTQENLKKFQQIIANYPEGRQKSAILPLLDLAQRQNDGYLTQEIIEYVADIIEVPHMRAYEVASFYSMFNLKPVGKFHIQICGTTPCWLRGAENIKEICKKELKIDVGNTTRDNMFTLSEVECLGACINSPVVQINDDYYEDLNEKSMLKILKNLKSVKEIEAGSQNEKKGSK
jgi:NADH-quinone oxidoreductase E subunit